MTAIREVTRRSIRCLALRALDQSDLRQAPGQPSSRGSAEPEVFETEAALVGRALGHPDDINAAVIGCAGPAGAGSSGDPRCVNALFAEIFHTVSGAVAGDFLGLGLLGI